MSEGKGEMTWQEVATLMRDSLLETAAQLANALAQVSELRVKLEELTVQLMQVDTEVVNSVLPEEDKLFAKVAARERTLQKRWEAREAREASNGDEVDLDSWRAQRLRNALSTLRATGAAEGTQVSVEVGPNQYCSYTQAELLDLLDEEA